MKNVRKIVSMNLIPERVDNLKKIVPSLSLQSDIFHVNLIGFVDTPSILNNYNNISVSKFDKVGAEYKFYHYKKYNNNNDFYFTVDDDIYYPENYCKTHIKYQLNNPNTITSVHGTTINLNLTEGFHHPPNRKEYYNFRHRLDYVKSVDVPGTGTLCMRGDILKFDLTEFKHKNMDDHFIGAFAKVQKIPIICIPRSNNWLKPLNEGGVSIWGNNPHHEIDKLIYNILKVNIQ